MSLKAILIQVLLALPLVSPAQRYLPDFDNEDAQKLFDRAEKAYIAGNYERCAKVYAYLMQQHGASYQLQFNHLTALVHTLDTAAIDSAFRQLLASPFLDCNFLTISELGKSLVGEDGAEAAWLVAQHGTHAPIEQVKLLPKLLAAAQAGEAKMSHYAHLFDLVCSHHRRPQRYGTLRWENPDTKIWETYPIEEPEMVDEYRKEAGLAPLGGG